VRAQIANRATAVESFVDPAHHASACRAAAFRRIPRFRSVHKVTPIHRFIRHSNLGADQCHDRDVIHVFVGPTQSIDRFRKWTNLAHCEPPVLHSTCATISLNRLDTVVENQLPETPFQGDRNRNSPFGHIACLGTLRGSTLLRPQAGCAATGILQDGKASNRHRSLEPDSRSLLQPTARLLSVLASFSPSPRHGH
jgi:hypothetical protein